LAGAIVKKRTSEENTDPSKKHKPITDKSEILPEKSKSMINDDK